MCSLNNNSPSPIRIRKEATIALCYGSNSYLNEVNFPGNTQGFLETSKGETQNFFQIQTEFPGFSSNISSQNPL